MNIENPAPYDLTPESDMEFREIMLKRKGSKKVRLAASKDFSLLSGLQTLMEDDYSGSWIGLPEEELIKRVNETIKFNLPEFEVTTTVMSGKILLAGSGVISLARKIRIGYDVFHSEMSVSNTGRNIGKQVFINQLVIYDNLDIKVASLFAAKVGKYAWAKYGFNPNESTITEFVYKMLEVCNIKNDEDMNKAYESSWGKYILYGVPEHIAYIAYIFIPKELLDDFISFSNMDSQVLNNTTYRGTDGSFLLGKYVLLNGKEWIGNLYLGKNYRDRDILEDYIGV